MKTVLLGIIAFYRKILSPVKPSCCRFVPTCSEYAREAIDSHGVVRGSFLAVRRLLKCHPFHEGGFDPVPQTAQRTLRHRKGDEFGTNI
ncbi:MAG TPA: membrane protein insertion efficiency factor YidD [Clostridiales bacterium]|nr:membrane protein insertion efficiency factor YidD [Clostridiales bacterium]